MRKNVKMRALEFREGGTFPLRCVELCESIHDHGNDT